MTELYPTREWAALTNVIMLADRPVSAERAKELVDAFAASLLERVARKIEKTDYTQAKQPFLGMYESQTQAWRGGRDWAAWIVRLEVPGASDDRQV